MLNKFNSGTKKLVKRLNQQGSSEQKVPSKYYVMFKHCSKGS